MEKTIKSKLVDYLLKGALSAALFFCASPKKADAGLVELLVEGEVTSVGTSENLNLDGSVQVGSIMTGRCVYDSDAPGQDFGHYYAYPIISISVNLGNYEFENDPDSTFPEETRFRVGYDGGVIYSLLSTSLVDGNILRQGVLEPFDNDLGYCGFSPFMKLWDSSVEYDPQNPFPLPDFSDSDLSDFDVERRFSIYFGYPELRSSFSLYGEITSLEVIPEPSTIALLGLGGLALIRRGRE